MLQIHMLLSVNRDSYHVRGWQVFETALLDFLKVSFRGSPAPIYENHVKLHLE